MSDRIIHEKLDRIQADIVEIKITMSENTGSLKEHMRRTDILEREMKPLSKHVAMVNGAMKASGAVATLLGAIYAAMKILGVIS